MSSDELTEPLGTVLGHLRRTLGSLADEMRPVGPGFVVRTRSLPLVWALNQIRILEPAEFDEVVALAERYQADLSYRHVVAEAGATAELAGPFAAAGWKIDNQVVMVLAREPRRKVDAEMVVELSQAQTVELMRRWTIDDFPGIGEAALGQLEEYFAREGRLWSETCFGILDAHGAPAAVTKLRSDGPTAWVEDVYTAPEARGRGYARTLVTYATTRARSAKCDPIFIIADDDDWPKHLYADIGFQPRGTICFFHQDLVPLERRVS